jgi:hypothetical protein
MANTTNYNWETPDDTDLVKDGAAAIRTLGSSIDTTTKNLNPETTTGDIAYRSATANTNTRLAIGSSGQVLTVAGGVPSWATPTTGDIEGVTAGTGISGGGTSGTVTITNSMATAIDAKGDLIAGTGADTFARLAVGTNGHTLVADSAEATGLKWAAPAGGGSTNAVFTNAKASGTDDGTFTSGAWRTRDLNTTDVNNISGASLSSNQITLPAGTYQVFASAPAFKVNNHQTRWYNITDSAVVQLGQNAYAGSGSIMTTHSIVTAVFTIAASKVFELQHRCGSTVTTEGFGVNNNWGTEIYSMVCITKVA